MRTYRRVQSLASGAVSPANKGLLLNVASASAIVTFVCLTPTGATVNVVLVLGVGNSIFPVYTQSWSSTGGTVTAWALN